MEVECLLKLGQGLLTFITKRRDDSQSYETIALALEKQTDGAVVVTGRTIQNWLTSLRGDAA